LLGSTTSSPPMPTCPPHKDAPLNASPSLGEVDLATYKIVEYMLVYEVGILNGAQLDYVCVYNEMGFFLLC